MPINATSWAFVPCPVDGVFLLVGADAQWPEREHPFFNVFNKLGNGN
jgi:hypothetical protein